MYQGAALDLARLAEKALALSRDTVDELDTWAGHVSVELIDELQGLRNEEARERAAEAIEMLGDWAFEALIVALNRVVDVRNIPQIFMNRVWLAFFELLASLQSHLAAKGALRS